MEKDKLTEIIIGCAFEVSNILGVGFLEKIYENALIKELKLKGLKVENQKAINVWYKGEIVGEYFSDIIIEDEVIVELKVAKELADIHTAQCINYLKATNKKLCLLINFGKSKVEIKRIVL